MITLKIDPGILDPRAIPDAVLALSESVALTEDGAVVLMLNAVENIRPIFEAIKPTNDKIEVCSDGENRHRIFIPTQPVADDSEMLTYAFAKDVIRSVVDIHTPLLGLCHGIYHSELYTNIKFTEQIKADAFIANMQSHCGTNFVMKPSPELPWLRFVERMPNPIPPEVLGTQIRNMPEYVVVLAADIALNYADIPEDIYAGYRCDRGVDGKIHIFIKPCVTGHVEQNLHAVLNQLHAEMGVFNQIRVGNTITCVRAQELPNPEPMIGIYLGHDDDDDDDDDDEPKVVDSNFELPTPISPLTVEDITNKFAFAVPARSLDEARADVENTVRVLVNKQRHLQGLLAQSNIKPENFSKQIEKIRAMAGVGSAECYRDYFGVVTTTLIVKDKDGINRDVGSLLFKIPYNIFQCPTTDIHIFNLDHIVCNQQAPHVNTEGRPCWGNAAPALVSALAAKDLEVLISIILEFLRHPDFEDGMGEITKYYPEAN